MKIVLATHHFPPRHVGGVELITYRLAQWLRYHGEQVEIVCIESIVEKEGTVVLAKQDHFENLKVTRLTISYQQGIFSFKQSYDHPTIGRWFEDYLRQVKPDLVHVHSGYHLSSSPIPAAKRVGLPVVVSLHDYWFVCHRFKLIRPDGSRCKGDQPASACAWCLMAERPLNRWMDRFTFGFAGSLQRLLASRKIMANHAWGRLLQMSRDRRKLLLERLRTADLILTQSPFLREKVISSGLLPEKVRLVPYGLALNDWPSVEKKTTTDGALHIGYLGEIAPPKGVHLLIRAFSRLRSLGKSPHLTIYGDLEQFPSYSQELKKLARNNSRITFAGRYENRRLPEILAGFDVVVVPSQWYEIGPLVTLEALAGKTPVVATNLPNMNAQIIHNSNGLLFEPDSFEDLARQLQRLIAEPELLKRLVSKIKRVRTSEQEASEIYEVYCEILQEQINQRRKKHRHPFAPYASVKP
jgi:glycosyltransferase involved in cell wall biosynthesis